MFLIMIKREEYNTVLVAEKLPVNGGEIKPIRLAKFIKQCGLQSWNESIILYNKPFDKNIKFKNNCQELTEKEYLQIQQSIQQNRSKQAIVKMNDQVGWGIMACEPIKKGSFLAMYAGELLLVEVNNPNQPDASYLLKLNESENGRWLLQVDAKNKGNLGRFYQHLPELVENDPNTSDIVFEDYQFASENIRATVATANIRIHAGLYDRQYLPVIKTTRDIQKGEIIGYDYGHYWRSQKMHPVLFHKNGNIVDSQHYQLRKVILRVMLDFPLYLDIVFNAEEFKKDCFIPIYTEHHEKKIYISEKDFLHAKNEAPEGSPYVYLPKPTAITENKRATQLGINFFKPEREPQKNILSVKKQEIPLTTEKLCLAIIKELKRITNERLLWKYNNNQSTAYLESKDSKLINTISLYLKKQGFEVQNGRNSITKNPLMYVKNPLLSQLLDTPQLDTNHDLSSELN